MRSHPENTRPPACKRLAARTAAAQRNRSSTQLAEENYGRPASFRPGRPRAVADDHRTTVQKHGRALRSEPAHLAGNDWQAISTERVAMLLGADPDDGLSSGEAARRLASGGANRLVDPPPDPAWKAFLRQFNDVLIRVLMGAGLLSVVVGDLKDAIVIAVVVGLNATVGFVQERRAEAALLALKRMLSASTPVRRDGRHVAIASEDIVPGDVVLLEAGERIPADGRLLVAQGLRIDESSLTGESEPSSKRTAAVPSGTPLAERADMAYMNTVVAAGRGEMLVTATGMATEMGRVAGMLRTSAAPATPLQKRLDHLGRRLAIVGVSVIVVIFALDLVRGEPLMDAIADSIALAVASIPEGLPTVVTVTLALGAFRLANRGAILRRIAAVETLGSTTVICSDKTGTLTLNQMTVRAVAVDEHLVLVTGEGYEPNGAIGDDDAAVISAVAPLLDAAVLCNDSRLADGALVGDPTEGALLALAAKGGVDCEALVRSRPRIAEVPFDHKRKLMITAHLHGGSIEIHVKGAPEAIMDRCSSVLEEGGALPMDRRAREHLNRQNGRLADRGLRVLALASTSVPADEFDPEADLLGLAYGLTLTGLVGMADPPRPEAQRAIAECRSAGVEVKMITGDQPSTAAAIALELGLEGTTLAGSELDAMSDAALDAAVDEVAVIARATPEHKVRIVRALRRLGHIVAMTGDGVNDAPALKEADIGVGMGESGTEVARQASAMVLADDNFATIVRAVREGRTIYGNIVKFVRFQLTTTVAALLLLAAAPLVGLPEPFTPIDILWIAIIMDGPPAIALGFDRAAPGLMQEPPRDPSEALLPPPRLQRLLLTGVLMSALTLILFAAARQTLDADAARSLTLTAFVLMQVFNALNVRSEYGTVLTRQLFTNRPLWGALGVVVALQAVAVSAPFANKLLDTAPLSATQWAVAVGAGMTLLVVDEVGKQIARAATKRSGTPPARTPVTG
jgi:P-type Ca2+ transporter type 2C